MKLYKLRVLVEHPYAYQPHKCNEATATRILWDDEQRRAVVELNYDNGAIDYIPLEELGKDEYYRLRR